jgi:hypothetical protein
MRFFTAGRAADGERQISSNLRVIAGGTTLSVAAATLSSVGKSWHIRACTPMMAKMVDSVFANRHQQIVNQRQNQHRKLYASVFNQIAKMGRGSTPL